MATNDELSRNSLQRWHVPESSPSSPRFYHKLCLVHAKEAHDKIKKKERNDKKRAAKRQEKWQRIEEERDAEGDVDGTEDGAEVAGTAA